MLPKYIPDYHDFNPGVDAVLYSGPWWDEKEINAATKSLMEGYWLSAGETVARFQNEFSRMFGVKFSQMTNSGSSANLVMIAALKKWLLWQDGDEVIVSPCGFPTTVAPLVQNGLKPVFVDIEYRTLNFNVDQIYSKISSHTKAIFVSPVLGNAPDMDELATICRMYNVKIIGDHCDSLGSRWSGELLNKHYYSWSSSFYPAHHISTGQGGIVCSDDEELLKIARSLTIWGRDCYCVGAANLLPCGTCGKRFSKWIKGADFDVDHKYIFSTLGYNLAPLDLQGAIGLEQLKKFPEIEKKRRENFHTISKFFEGIPSVRVADHLLQSDPSWFGVPLICDSTAIRGSLVKHLEAHKIQSRPYFAGNLLRHPAYEHLGNPKDYPLADRAFSEVFFLGCPPHYTQKVLDYISEVVAKWKTQSC